VGWRARADLGDINSLCASILETGQIQPVAVRRVNGHHELVAGARRVTACEKIGCKVIAVEVQADDELESLDMQLAENLSRKNFDEVEVGRGLVRRKAVYQEFHPETRVGTAGGGKDGQGTRTKKTRIPESGKPVEPAERFSKVTAKKFGLREQRVNELIQLGSMSKKDLAEVDKADTTARRNRAAKDALRRIRVERKRERLITRARAAETKRASKTEEVGAVERMKVVLRLEDNAAFFARSAAESFALILTDPPYGQRQSLIQHVARGMISTSFGAWDKLDVGWVVKAAPLLAEGGQFLVFSPLEAIGEYKWVFESLGLNWRGAIVWKKTNPGTAHRNIYLSTVEAVCWATKGDHYHFMPFENAGSAEAHNLIEGPICQGNERLDHPTQKPEWLIERLLKRHAPPGGRVLDPFVGVGTTLVVCKRLGLEAEGIEVDPGFAHQAKHRLQAMG
jgi:site-specific DNA-methyltransferase (adenine-specific)